MRINKLANYKRLFIHKKIYQTEKATLYSLVSQSINGYICKNYTEVWIPKKVEGNINHGLNFIEIKEEFYKKLIF